MQNATASGPKMSENAQSEDGCTFPSNVFAPFPEITPKPHFGGPFNAKPIMQISLRKSHVDGATKVKLYSYHGLYGSTSCSCISHWPK